MGSLVKTYTLEKLFGQVYTPDFIVCKILDDIHFDSPNVLGKRIIDPACGDGRFLIEVAKRVIRFSEKGNMKYNLECIFGWDIDDDAVRKCIENLNELIKDEHILVQWNIFHTDAIMKKPEEDLFTTYTDTPKFDFIIGNPPYIRIQHLDVIQRQYIQRHYRFCQSGSTDIYIAFFELCLYLLSEDGICGLITPNTFLFTETARTMRLYFTKQKKLLQITNYGDLQLFKSASTYSAITLFTQKSNPYFIYQKALTKQSFETGKVDFSELKGAFWQLSNGNSIKVNGTKLKDICHIHVGITTLCDKAYIFRIEPINEDLVYAFTELKGKVKMEKAILKPIIKVSRIKQTRTILTEYILFPYYKTNGKHLLIEEAELRNKYPLAYNYLISIKHELDKRDNGKPITPAWYAFGRSQGLDTSFGEKIVFSPINNKPNFVHVSDKESTFYSGYCIKFDGNIEMLLPQLNSDRMANFIEISSRSFRGGWKAYNKKIIEHFEVNI